MKISRIINLETSFLEFSKLFSIRSNILQCNTVLILILDGAEKDGEDKPTEPRAPSPMVVVPEVFMQPPFQSGSTPIHLPHRFMVSHT